MGSPVCTIKPLMFLLTTKTEQQSNHFVEKKNATEKQILKIVDHDLNIFSPGYMFKEKY